MNQIKNTLTISEKIESEYCYKTAHINFNNNISQDIYIKFPITVKHLLTDLADPFVVLTIFRMMETSGDIFVKGKINASLLNNLEHFCDCWITWLPNKYKKIRIIADEEVQDEPTKLTKKAISCFSGGVDATFTAYRHKMGLAGRNNLDIDRAIMIHGADITLNKQDLFKNAFKTAKKITDELKIELIPIETNFRELPHYWGIEFFGVMSACLLFFEKNYNYALVGSGESLIPLPLLSEPWGSNSVSNNFLSSNNFKIITDDHSFTRTQKIEVISKWKPCLKFLRVCWENKNNNLNCGICEKCVRTHLNFKVVGVDNLEFMPNKFNLKLLSKVKIDNIPKLDIFREIFNYAQMHNSLDKKTLNTLKKVIKRNSKHINNRKFPKWLGKIICFFIVKEKNKQHFYIKYIKK